MDVGTSREILCKSWSHREALTAGPVDAVMADCAASRQHLIIVEVRDRALQPLGQWLAKAGFRIDVASEPADVLRFCEEADRISVVLLDCGGDSRSGMRLLRELQRIGITLPIVCVVQQRHAWLEELALELGAADVLERSARPSILARRILRAASAYGAANGRPHGPLTLELGSLRLNLGTSHCRWRGRPVPLTATEFRIVHALASRAGEDISYRMLYDAVRGQGFIAGSGREGFRTNVRSLIKRVRQKFAAVDPGFSEIENYAGFGYRWRLPT